MSLKLTLEIRRLKIIEDHLAILAREAADLTEAMIEDTREGNPTTSLRWMISANRADVRSAIADWDGAKNRIALLKNSPLSKRARRGADGPSA